MYRFYILMALAIFLFSACGSNLADNSSVTEENTNPETENTNTIPELADEEVPEFEDAGEALQKGTEYLDKNRIDNAIAALKQAVELDKDLAGAHFQLGVALSLKESEEEQRVPDDFNSEDTKKPKKAEKKESEIAFENAVKAYRKQVAKNRKDHAAYYNLGRSYVKLFDDKKARNALDRAVRLKGDDAQYRTELGAVLIKLAQYSSAIRQLRKALELEEGNYRAEDLLVKARAGRKRVDYVPKGNRQARRSSGPASNASDGSTRPREVPTLVNNPPPAPKAPPAPPKKN